MGHVNEADLEWSERTHGASSFRRKQLGQTAGGEKLGCSLYELGPGNRSWPYHYHAANEEAIFVLSGNGSVRLTGGQKRLRTGDYVALPADESGAHRVVNDGEEPLRYLLVSTMREPDVTVYPDSEKVGVFVGAPPGSDRDRTVHGYFRRADAVDYWDGEA